LPGGVVAAHEHFDRRVARRPYDNLASGGVATDAATRVGDGRHIDDDLLPCPHDVGTGGDRKGQRRRRERYVAQVGYSVAKTIVGAPAR
jgi:hypothetical protein